MNDLQPLIPGEMPQSEGPSVEPVPTRTGADPNAGLQALAASLIALGNPQAAQLYVTRLGQMRAANLKAGATGQTGAYLARANELAGQGDEEGALEVLRQAMRGETDPTLLKETLGQVSTLTKTTEKKSAQARASTGLTNVINTLSKKNDIEAISDNEAALIAAGLARDIGLEPDKIPSALPTLKKFVQTSWKELDLGEKKYFVRESNPTQFIPYLATRLHTLATGQGTQALVRTEGGIAKSVEAQTQPKMLVGPEQSVEQVPGVQLPQVGTQESQAPSPQAPQIKLTGGTPGSQETSGGTTQTLVPPREKRTPLSEGDQVLLRSVGINKGAVEDLSRTEAGQLTALKKGETDIRPTAEQAPLLSKQGINPNQTWGQIHAKYPNAAEIYLRDRDQADAAKVVARVLAEKESLANIPYAEAFDKSTKVIYDKRTGMRNDGLYLSDVRKGTAVLLSQQSHDAMVTLQGAMPSLLRLRSLAQNILSKSGGGTNIANAFSLAIQSKAATSKDLAAFEALSGSLGQMIARAIERARTSDQDANRILLSFPKTTDTVATGLARLDSMIDLLNDSMGAMLGKPTVPLTAANLGPKGAQAPVQGSRRSGGDFFNNRAFER